MAKRLTIKDSVTQWIDKLNKIINMNTVDGSFHCEQDQFDSTDITISGGVISVGTATYDVAGGTLTIPINNTYVVGVDTTTNSLAYYQQQNVPQSQFIPLYVVETNNLTITSIKDVRTFAKTSDGVYATIAYVDQTMTNHVDAADPHPQYNRDAVDPGLAVVSASSAYFNARDASVYSYLFTADESIVLACPDDGKSYSMTLLLQGVPNYNITWPANLNWINSQIPSIGSRGIVTVFTPDSGTTWIGSYAGTY